MKIAMTSQLTDDQLVGEVARLAQRERDATAVLIARLAELHGRRLHERAGFASLFTYCTTVLRMSEHEAYDRMKAAKVSRRFPAVLELLAAGRLNLTTVRLLAPHLTRANHVDLLAAAVDKNKRQVQELLAARFPQPDVAASIRRVSAPSPRPEERPSTSARPAAAADPSDAGGGPVCPPGTDSSPSPMPTATPMAAPPTLIQPLAPDRYHVHFTASASLRDKLRRAQDLLRHAIPTGDPAEVIERALDVLIEDLVKQKYAVTDSPRARRGAMRESGRVQGSELVQGSRRSRHIPAEVRRAALARDGDRCAYIAPDGRRCDERGFLEFHHVKPFAADGPATIGNIELRCRAHNAYEAERYFGPGQQFGVSGGTRFRSGTKTAGAADGWATANGWATADGWMTRDWRTPPRPRRERGA